MTRERLFSSRRSVLLRSQSIQQVYRCCRAGGYYCQAGVVGLFISILAFVGFFRPVHTVSLLLPKLQSNGP